MIDEFAGFDRADEFGADDVERDRLRREDVRIAELADHQRANAERVAAADHALGGEADQRIGTFDLFQSIDEPVEQRAIGRCRDEMDNDLGIAGRLKDRTAANQHFPERGGIRDIAVVRNRESRRWQGRRTGAGRYAARFRPLSNSERGRRPTRPATGA